MLEILFLYWADYKTFAVLSRTPALLKFSDTPAFAAPTLFAPSGRCQYSTLKIL